MDQERLRAVWRQKKIPVVVRSDEKGRRLRVRLPFAENNRQWLNTIGKSSVTWIDSKDYWELPKNWFNSFVNRSLERYGSVYVIQPYREQEKCAPACKDAQGHECQCSCMGANHGAGNDGSWFDVSETFATRYGQKDVACRLMTAKKRARSIDQFLEELI